jgi:hypothetical protein
MAGGEPGKLSTAKVTCTNGRVVASVTTLPDFGSVNVNAWSWNSLCRVLNNGSNTSDAFCDKLSLRSSAEPSYQSCYHRTSEPILTEDWETAYDTWFQHENIEQRFQCFRGFPTQSHFKPGTVIYIGFILGSECVGRLIVGSISPSS